MNRVEAFSTRSARDQLASLLKLAHRTALTLFLITCGLMWLETWWPVRALEKFGGLDGLLVLTATATTLLSLSRQVPGQNVLLAAVVVALIGGGAHAIGALRGIPFGPLFYTDAAGPRLFHVLPWAIPFVWVVVVLNSRGVARLILRPRQDTPAYGLWGFGLTVALTGLFDFCMEPYATTVSHYWFWGPTKLGLAWYGTPVSNFLAWMVVTLLMLAFVTPPVINKSYVRLPPDYHPLIVWLLLCVIFTAGTLAHGLWLAAGCTFLINAVAAAFAIHGGRALQD